MLPTPTPVMLLLGRSRTRRVRALGSWIDETDDAGVPRALLVTGNRAQGPRIPDPPVSAFAQRTVTFDALLRDLWWRFGDGRAVWSRGGLELLAETAQLPPSTVALHTLVREGWHRLPRDHHGTAARAALSALDERLAEVPGRVTWARAVHDLCRRLESPSPGLRRWLTRVERCVIDEVLPSPAGTAALIALVAALTRHGASVVVGLETGRSLGGAEAGVFFEADDLDLRGHAMRGFAASRDLRRALFQTFVAQGDATVAIASPGGGVRRIEPWSVVDDPEAPDLTDVAYAGRVLTEATAAALVEAASVTFHRCDDATTEVHHAVQGVATTLRSGVAADQCAVAVTTSAQADAVVRTMRRLGIPANPTVDVPLVTAPITRSLIAAAAEEDDVEADPGAHAVSLSARLDLLAAQPCPLDWAAQRQRRAAGALRHAIATLVGDLRACDAGPMRWATWLDHVTRVVHGTSYRPHTPHPRGVAVVRLADLTGGAPAHVWAIGLRKGLFPHPPTPCPLDPSAERTEASRRARWARYAVLGLIRAATVHPQHRVSLSWPTTQDGAASAPAPVVADLLAVPLQGGGLLGDTLVDDAEPALLPPRHPLPTGVGPAQDRSLRARRASTFGAYDMMLDPAPAAPRRLSVTALETYLKCPARYAFRFVLGLSDDEPDALDVDPRARGTTMHRVLQDFVEAGELHRPDAAHKLYDRALAAIRALEDEDEAGDARPAVYAHLRAQWLDGLVDGSPAGILATWLGVEHSTPSEEILGVEQDFDDLPVGPVLLRGTIDRVDRVDGGIVVLDYKTGRPPETHLLQRGLALQAVAYAAATARRYPRTAIATTFQALRRAEEVRRTGWAGHPFLLRALGARGVDIDDRARGVLMDHAAKSAERLCRGTFHTTLADPEDVGCEHCAYKRICRVDHARNALVRDDDLQRPVGQP